MTEIVMPRLSDSMEEGTILTWHVAVGDTVEVGQEIAEIETDKANMGYEADVAGTVAEIVVGEAETVAVGAVIARIGGDGDAGEGADAAAAGPVAETTPASAPPADEAAAQGPARPEPTRDGERIKASPLARRLAKERGIELSGLRGSGPGGRIVKSDVEAAAPGAAARAPAPSPEGAKGTVSVEEPNRLQQTVARRMAESKATAPHFYLEAEIEMSACVEARARIKAAADEGEAVPSFNDMVVKACALALRELPKANASYRDGRFELYSRVNVGVAVAAPGALVVPTVFDADRKGLRQIAAETRELAAKVREGTVTPPELAGGTFTVSNLGMYGVSSFSAVVNSGQAAILAVGAIVERPVIRDGEPVSAHLMGATLSCDHRILYGAEGAEFLARVRGVAGRAARPGVLKSRSSRFRPYGGGSTTRAEAGLGGGMRVRGRWLSRADWLSGV